MARLLAGAVPQELLCSRPSPPCLLSILPACALVPQAQYQKSSRPADEALAYMFANNRGIFADETEFDGGDD